MKRSDSSKNQREQLKGLGYVPDISSTVPIDQYYEVASHWREESAKNYNLNDLDASYINLFKFATLISKIAQHNAYNSKINEKNKFWAQRSFVEATADLDRLVYELDKNEDERILQQQQLALIDEFDELGFDDPVLLPGSIEIPLQQPTTQLINPSINIKSRKEMFDKLRLPGGSADIVLEGDIPVVQPTLYMNPKSISLISK